jgi:hypothetical protein
MGQGVKKLAVAAIALALHFPASTATAGQPACNRYHGMSYIICSESGPSHMPNGLPSGVAHPGKSSASGPCGFLAKTRRRYGGDSLRHCHRYLNDRYRTPARAEQFHRRHNYW